MVRTALLLQLYKREMKKKLYLLLDQRMIRLVRKFWSLFWIKKMKDQSVQTTMGIDKEGVEMVNENSGVEQETNLQFFKGIEEVNADWVDEDSEKLMVKRARKMNLTEAH